MLESMFQRLTIISQHKICLRCLIPNDEKKRSWADSLFGLLVCTLLGMVSTSSSPPAYLLSVSLGGVPTAFWELSLLFIESHLEQKRTLEGIFTNKWKKDLAKSYHLRFTRLAGNESSKQPELACGGEHCVVTLLALLKFRLDLQFRYKPGFWGETKHFNYCIHFPEMQSKVAGNSSWWSFVT
jgi:hypothetical protein